MKTERSACCNVCTDYKSQRGLKVVKGSVVALFELVDRKRIAAVALLVTILQFLFLWQLVFVIL